MCDLSLSAARSWLFRLAPSSAILRPFQRSQNQTYKNASYWVNWRPELLVGRVVSTKQRGSVGRAELCSADSRAMANEDAMSSGSPFGLGYHRRIGYARGFR
jgi:hypothetical protein